MLNNIKIKLSVFGFIYLFILFFTMLVILIPVMFWWLVTGYMVSNIIFIKICGLVTTIIFLISCFLGITLTEK
mgnify:CR=1 FL=1|jgi:hypothetical protein